MAATVRPIHFRTADPELSCVHTRVVGFRAIDRGAFVGPFRRAYRRALDDARTYNRKGRP